MAIKVIAQLREVKIGRCSRRLLPTQVSLLV